jgi:hypothetical protein
VPLLPGADSILRERILPLAQGEGMSITNKMLHLLLLCYIVHNYCNEKLIFIISVADPQQRQVVDKRGSEAKTERVVSMDLHQTV